MMSESQTLVVMNINGDARVVGKVLELCKAEDAAL